MYPYNIVNCITRILRESTVDFIVTSFRHDLGPFVNMMSEHIRANCNLEHKFQMTIDQEPEPLYDLHSATFDTIFDLY